jgi:hypothetical protein
MEGSGATVEVIYLGYRGPPVTTQKTLDTISSLQRQTAGEPYTLYLEMAPPLQAEEVPPTKKELTLRTIHSINSPTYD